MPGMLLEMNHFYILGSPVAFVLGDSPDSACITSLHYIILIAYVSSGV